MTLLYTRLAEIEFTKLTDLASDIACGSMLTNVAEDVIHHSDSLRWRCHHRNQRLHIRISIEVPKDIRLHAFLAITVWNLSVAYRVKIRITLEVVVALLSDAVAGDGSFGPQVLQ